MENLRFYFALSAAMVFLLIFSVISAHAHGTDYRIVEDAKTVTFEFFYDDREPMQYSEVLVFSPNNDRIEYQNGRTDSKGADFHFILKPQVHGASRLVTAWGTW